MVKEVGVCRLLGTKGPFENSHIIPDAFMRRVSAAPFMQWDGQNKPKKLFTGWYDKALLSREGEALIARYDDYIAKILLRAGWTYRKRRPLGKPEKLEDAFVANDVYCLSPVDTNLVRLFALSMLWRAAETNNEGFSNVTLRSVLRENLKQRILSGDAGHYMEFPVYFTLYDSKFELTKMAATKFDGHPFFRFFMDGVACYVGKSQSNLWSRKNHSMMVGAQADRLIAVCINSESSHHARNDREMMSSLADAHGDVFRSFYKQ